MEKQASLVKTGGLRGKNRATSSMRLIRSGSETEWKKSPVTDPHL